MVNRTALGLALALLLLVPMGVGGTAGSVGEVFDQETRVRAQVTDVHGMPVADPGASRATAAPVEAHAVEGHTTFAVVDVKRRAAPEAWHVVGHVACRFVVLGVDVPGPASLHRASDACTPGSLVLFTAGDAPAPDVDALEATGWSRVAHAPDTGRPVTITEYAYATRDGGTAYAWGTEVLPRSVNPHTGASYNFVGAVNVARLAELDENRLTVWTLDRVA